MAKFDVAAVAAGALADGEDMVAAVRVNWNGMVPPVQTSANTVLSEPEAPDPDKLVAFPSAKQMLLVLTGGRLLAWSLGLSGKPKQYLGDVGLSAIESAEAGDMRYGTLVRITMKSSAIVDLEVMRGEDAEGFLTQLGHLLG